MFFFKSRKCYITRLSNDTFLHEISHYLSVSDKKRLALTNKKFFSLFNANISSCQEQLFFLFNFITHGKQSKAEAIIKNDPGLLLEYQTITDHADRIFSRITPFQYALWALDRHMWTMILKYLPKINAQSQLEELLNNGTEHGLYFDYQPLLNAYETHDCYYRRSGRFNYTDECSSLLKTYWLQIGSQQRLCPAHVINEYCHPKRALRVGGFPYDQSPAFNEINIPRSTKNEQQWQIYSLAKGRGLGYDYALYRSYNPSADCNEQGRVNAYYDERAIRKLFSVRLEEFKQLEKNLCPTKRKETCIIL